MLGGLITSLASSRSMVPVYLIGLLVGLILMLFRPWFGLASMVTATAGYVALKWVAAKLEGKDG